MNAPNAPARSPADEGWVEGAVEILRVYVVDLES